MNFGNRLLWHGWIQPATGQRVLRSQTGFEMPWAIAAHRLCILGKEDAKIRASPVATLQQRKRASTMCDGALDPRTGSLKERLAVGHGLHMPEEPTIKKARCSLHSWGNKKRFQAHILWCSSCSVHLCVPCFKLFHTVQEVNDLRQHFVTKAAPNQSEEATSLEVIWFVTDRDCWF